jgi:site-specific DNA-methyltransferase (adenine-specific)
MKNKTKLLNGDNLQLLKTLPDNSIDSIVTDGPYGLKFMGKKWDYNVPSVEFWKECLRVIKPGGYVLSFGGTRTYHRQVCNLEDGGFEIRDCISWLYGSGFPKSHNIGKAVDKINGVEREVINNVKQPRMNNDYGKGVYNERELKEIDITKGSSPQEGYGTALKPAQELICMARKPISEKTVAENVLKWGTGGINIDGCRVGNEEMIHNGCGKSNIGSIGGSFEKGTKDNKIFKSEGRFPANIIFDEEAAKELDRQSGVTKGKPSYKTKTGGYQNSYVGGELKNGVDYKGYPESGGASRFFYIAKVSKKERNMGLDGFEEVEITDETFNSFDENGNRLRKHSDGSTSIIKPIMRANHHPCVKPINLLTYLVRLVTPPNGIVLDPFMGSGSTGIAALLEGFRFCGMELDKSYFDIATARIESFEEYRKLIKKKD